MRFDPTLVITRAVVERGDQAAYDEVFHPGINVIRGENSSGKSTILNFLFYGLGGDLADWSETALLCSRVMLEVQMTGKTATLSREISRQIGQPMEIFGGDYEASRSAPRTEWVRYPYRRSAHLESFSQALFRLLKIPEVTSDMSGNVTMHQLLRLLYADQLSPIEDIFRFEHFNDPALRDAVGRLLCGAYDSRIYDNDVRIRTLTREFDSVSGELRSHYAVFGQVEQSLTPEWVDAERAVLDQQRQALQTQIEETEQQLYTVRDQDQFTLRSQETAYGDVQKLQHEIVSAQQERDGLLLTIADSVEFINSLENKVSALNDSVAVADHFGEVQFTVCPACYAPIEKTEENLHACHLCKTPFDVERMRGRIVAVINDTAIQLKQSRQLQVGREQRREDVEGRIQQLMEAWQRASRRLASLQRLPSSDLRDELRRLHHQAGYLERQIEDLAEKARIIALIHQLSERKDALNDAITRLRTETERLRVEREERLANAYTRIADEVRKLLRNDLRRQDSFENAQNISFGFRENKITVDGHTYFSASSRVILKSSFVIGFCAAAIKDPAFRHPRFCIVDTIEDKGMEPERSHNFQNQILRISEESKVEHQIIYATSMISPDLDDEKFTIGKFSTRDDPTLLIPS
jgi:predicted  nucleic acid-binding Zn-ribbon protein